MMSTADIINNAIYINPKSDPKEIIVIDDSVS